MGEQKRMQAINYMKEANYAADMDVLVQPYLKERKKSGDFARVPGEKIHYRIYSADTPRGELVLVHGFSEGIDKFNEAIYYFLQAGYNVWQIQQRGHGASYRAVADPSLVYITDFHDLIEDLHYFVTEIVKKQQRKPAYPRYLFGHSMGGGVSAAYLETYPEDFEKAILSSPMLEMNSGGTPIWVATLFARCMILLGKGKNYMPGSSPFQKVPDFENSCTNCKVRYDYWFEQMKDREEYHTCASAIETALQFLKLTRYAGKPENCKKVKAKVLLVQAGKDNMVNPGGQETFLRQIGSRGELFRMEDAKHEIYLCSDKEQAAYWDKVFSFLENN